MAGMCGRLLQEQRAYRITTANGFPEICFEPVLYGDRASPKQAAQGRVHGAAQGVRSVARAGFGRSGGGLSSGPKGPSIANARGDLLEGPRLSER
jgi:hypothetical protein